MKKFIFVALFLLALVLVVTPAFALTCKSGNYGSDECWSTGQTTTNDVGQLITGSLMVYDFTTGVNEGNSADNAAFYVRTASSYDQNVIAAGFLQKNYASGDRVEMLVRGQGKVRSTTAVTSGDRLYAMAGTVAQRGLVSTVSGYPYGPAKTGVVSTDKCVAFALTTTAAAATTDAFVTII
jgi:hypothetical protein